MPLSQQGFVLADAIVALALVASLSAVAVPFVDGLHDRARVRAAARYLSGRLRAAQLEALSRNATVGVRIGDEDRLDAFRLFVDGNGNGLRQSDVALGIDGPIDAPDRLTDHFADITFRVPADVPDIGTSDVIAAGADPVRIGSSRFVSFNPFGGCTSGTLFIAGAHGPQAAVRLLGQTGRIRALWFDAATRTWRED